jgi:acyl phosphate:glycerol-3-phosphate acyltransferase
MVQPSFMFFLLTAITSYLLGSLPFGYLLVRIFRGQDVRETGSGNIGATNVARTSPGLGAATLALDALKGFAAAALARYLHPEAASVFMATAALFAIVGHMFPVWLGWRGGKGVATALGSFLCVAPKSVLLMVAIFVVVVAISRYISLGSIVAAFFSPVIVSFTEHIPADSILMIGVACGLIIAKHHENIGRLFRGSENKFSLGRG